MNKYMFRISMLIILGFSMTLAINAETYSYDTIGRLTSVTYNDGTKISYVYDASGNRLSRTIFVPNVAPVANNDTTTVQSDTSIAIDVLVNDTDSDGSIDATSVSIVTDVTNGNSSVDPTTGVVTYTPTTGYSGADSFTYTVNDNEGAASNEATVSITVEAAPPNQAPVANNDVVTTNYNTAITISVLANDTDADGSIDTSSVVIGTTAANGSTTVNASGQVVYTPNSGYSGADSFTYTVDDDDGDTSNAATVTITVRAKPSSGGGGGGGGSMGASLLLLLLAGLLRRTIKR